MVTWLELERVMQSDNKSKGKRQVPDDFTQMWDINNSKWEGDIKKN